jgi:serine/threonine-protein phosphatase CPPED1
MKKSFWFAAPILCLAVFLMGCAGVTKTPPPEFTFVQMCDPQLGFSDYAADRGRLRQAVEQINALKPDFVVICGDLVNGANPKSFADFNAAKAGLAMPCYCAPGNHDVGNTPTLKSLQQYRERIGKDYYSFEHKGCTFVVANTQLWKAPVAGESEKQDVWFKQTLEAAASLHHRCFLISHYPMFVKTPDEPDEYYNLPIEKRKELLALCERCGVVAMLAGHTHTTTMKEYQGIQVVTSETTSRNFDHRPFGFRVWHIGPTRPYQNEFVELKK